MRSDVVPDPRGTLDAKICRPARAAQTSPAPRWWAFPVGLLGAVTGAAIAALACGGTAQQVAIGPVPPRDTRAVLAGPLCADNRCSCRDPSLGGDGGAGTPDGASKKRFEVRLGPSPQELWLTINRTTVLYKSAERAEMCFYVDLPTGEQAIELRASNPDGVSAALQIHELGTRTTSWYDTFAFSCGSPGVCSFDELDANKARYAQVKRQIHDPCGTTKVKGITWDHGKAPDQLHPSELVLRLTLDIYRFAAWKQAGDPTCGQGGGRPPGDDAAPADPAAEKAP